jgi:two-component system, sensor histidine kinase RegB
VASLYTANALHLNLQRLLVIRLIVFVCQLLALLYARFILELALDYGLIAAIFLALGLVNGALHLRLKRHASPNQLEFFLHLLVDLLGLSLLLYFTGGASNPFVSYFLVPVTIAAATLTRSYTAVLAALALLCYTLLLFFYQPLPALMPSAMSGMDHALHEAGGSDSLANLHILGMWFNFLVSAALITWFVVRMAAEIRAQQERLSRYREDTLRNEQILAVATQAAGTAHEMGTPLGTMAVLLQELRVQYTSDAALQQDLALLQQQVGSCRDALRTLVQKADFRNQKTVVVSLREFIQALLDQWQLLRPELPCEVFMQVGEGPQVAADSTLQQALINLLNNAADASPRGIELALHWDSRQWTLRIRDHGEGLSREVAEQLGTRIASTKEGGLGVGWVLSQATLNRLGGSVSLYPQEGGGTLTEITLPCATKAGGEHG